MKTVLLFLVSFLAFHKTEAQILKKLIQKAKDNAQWRVERTENQKINQGMDSLENLPKKIREKKQAKQTGNSNPSNAKENGPSTESSLASSGEEKDDMSQKDGYLTFTLSANSVFAGGVLTVSGESIKYKSMNQVEVMVSGPSVKDVKSVPLTDDGKFATVWFAGEKTGEYTVVVKSSDKKVQKSQKFTIYALPQMSSWADGNIEATKEAYNHLKDVVGKVEANVSPKDKALMQGKMDEVKEKVDEALNLFNELNTAGKKTAALVQSARNFPPRLASNLSELNNALADQARQMKSFEKLSKHEPLDNSICEYIVLVNEACAAFSAFANFHTTVLKDILLNISLDKGVPMATSALNNSTAQISAPYDFIPKEAAKIFATAKIDAASLTTKMGKAGIAGDLIQFGTDVLMKQYCGVFKGIVKHDYTVIFRNSDGQVWWKYGVSMQGALMLRYPKENAKGKVIKMKGDFEGNATKFTFFQDVQVEDGFFEGSKGKIQVIELQVLKPPAYPFVSSLNDPAGFGAIARTIITPACFDIVVDAEYDVDADKIKLFVTGSNIDFSPAVVNQLIFLEVGGDLLPYIKRMMFPIHKVKTTFGSIVRDHGEFDIQKDKSGNLSFTGTANKHLGSHSDKIEHDLNLTIAASKQ